MDTDNHVYIRFGDRETQEPLRMAAVSSHADLKYVLRLDTALRVELNSPVMLFHQIERRFFSQAGTVESVCAVSQNETVMTVTCDGEPVLAENRAAFRAVTVGRQLTATIGRERKCEILNVSVNGLAVVMINPPEVGTEVEITIEVDNKPVRGRGTIRNRVPMSCKRYKCGLQVQDKQLSRALNDLCMAVQREQLRRLARA